MIVVTILYLSGYDVKEAISTQTVVERLENALNKALTLLVDKTRDIECDILISYVARCLLQTSGLVRFYLFRRVSCSISER